jgi:hypothetical protein
MISAPENDTPRRARAYLLTDDMVMQTAAAHSEQRPSLDAISGHALAKEPSDGWPDMQAERAQPRPTYDAPETILWSALTHTPSQGISVADLINAVGMSRLWVYLRLRELTSRGQAGQVSRGLWRAPNEHEA